MELIDLQPQIECALFLRKLLAYEKNREELAEDLSTILRDYQVKIDDDGDVMCINKKKNVMIYVDSSMCVAGKQNVNSFDPFIEEIPRTMALILGSKYVNRREVLGIGTRFISEFSIVSKQGQRLKEKFVALGQKELSMLEFGQKDQNRIVLRLRFRKKQNDRDVSITIEGGGNEKFKVRIELENQLTKEQEISDKSILSNHFQDTLDYFMKSCVNGAFREIFELRQMETNK